MARFLVDEDCPKAIARLLQARGLDALHVQEAGFAGYKDRALLQRGAILCEGRLISLGTMALMSSQTFPVGSFALNHTMCHQVGSTCRQPNGHPMLHSL